MSQIVVATAAAALNPSAHFFFFSGFSVATSQANVLRIGIPVSAIKQVCCSGDNEHPLYPKVKYYEKIFSVTFTAVV